MIIRTKSDFIASGNVSKVEYKTFGEKKYPKLEFGLKYDYDSESKKGLYLNCVCMFENAKKWKYLQSNMEIMVCGKYKQRPNPNNPEKPYEDYTVTFIANSLQFAVEEEQPEELSEDNDESNETLPF